MSDIKDPWSDIGFCSELESLLKRMKNIIFVPTCQSSGTWFMIDLFKAHDQINWVIPNDYWHDPIIKELNVKRLLKDDSTVVLHIHHGGTEDVAKIQLIENIFKISDHIVMPIRNPLRSILTAYIRDHSEHKDLNKIHIIHGYIKLVEWTEKHNVFIVPVDLYSKKSKLERYFLLRDLFDFVQLPYEKYMKQWANDWPVSNTVGTLQESTKLLFDTKNIEGIKQIMPKEYDLLMSSAPILKPFFESQGYSKDDLWWWEK